MLGVVASPLCWRAGGRHPTPLGARAGTTPPSRAAGARACDPPLGRRAGATSPPRAAGGHHPTPSGGGRAPPHPLGRRVLATPPPRLAAAHKLTASREMLLWMTPSEAPKALQASECSELLDPMRASCGIFAQH